MMSFGDGMYSQHHTEFGSELMPANIFEVLDVIIGRITHILPESEFWMAK